MDQPVLHLLARELADSKRLGAFADALPAPARVSEPALPLILAALHLRLGRGLVCLLPEDGDARDTAEAAGWFLGEERVAFMPSRGVSLGSGLRPPPHLVGERFRALDVHEAGGLVCVSATALAEGLPPAELRPPRLEVGVGDELGIDALADASAVAGYERVERAEERGQFAVRGGIVDVYPATGREPVRIEFLGDEVEAIRAFSPFTQRALWHRAKAGVCPITS
jgi:transcription-repair coupling factor (superfamily II helicase)